MLGLVAGCPAAPQWECVAESTDCAPLYEPTFDNVYTNTITRSCGVGAGSCHGPGASTGIDLSTIDATYELLMGAQDLPAYVLPGEPNCSQLMIRIDQPDPADTMPPGLPLSEAERCAIRQWVQEGGLR